MRAYDFSTHNKTVKRDRSRYFSYTFLFLLVAAFAAFIYYVVLNSPRILFYFRENKYSGIENLHAQGVAAINAMPAGSETIGGALALPEVSDFMDTVHTLQKDHNEDPILFFHEASILDEIVRKQTTDHVPQMLALLFRDFIGKPQFPKDFDQALWQRALLTGRRARALGLPDVLAQKISEAEIEIYLLGGRPWWQSAQDVIPSGAAARKLPAWHVIQAGLNRETPDFELIATAYGKTLATFAKGIYYTRSGNSPLGISSFRELAKNDADAFAKDHALYALGFLSGREKRIKDQLFYYKQIRFAEFAPLYPHFASELHYLLRFLGEKSEADQLMHAWEELKAKKSE
jgi:hypothetical protein